MLIFITGGVRSGKSSYAEQTATHLLTAGVSAYYVATSIRTDEEMILRIQKHQMDRDRDHVKWTTFEQQRDLHKLAGLFQTGDVVLLDCLTNLLNNELFEGWESGAAQWTSPMYREKVYAKVLTAINKLLETNIQLIIVSNELSFDLMSSNKDGTYYFIELLGKLHQVIVQKSDLAFLVEDGIPIIMKGS